MAFRTAALILGLRLFSIIQYRVSGPVREALRKTLSESGGVCESFRSCSRVFDERAGCDAGASGGGRGDSSRGERAQLRRGIRSIAVRDQVSFVPLSASDAAGSETMEDSGWRHRGIAGSHD